MVQPYHQLNHVERYNYILDQQVGRSGIKYRIEQSCIGRFLSIFCCCLTEGSLERNWKEHRLYIIRNRPAEDSPDYNLWCLVVQRVNVMLPNARISIHRPRIVTNYQSTFVTPQVNARATIRANSQPNYIQMSGILPVGFNALSPVNLNRGQNFQAPPVMRSLSTRQIALQQESRNGPTLHKVSSVNQRPTSVNRNG